MNRLLSAVNTVASLVSAGAFLYFAEDLLKIEERTIGINVGGFVLTVIAVLFVVTLWINLFDVVRPED